MYFSLDAEWGDVESDTESDKSEGLEQTDELEDQRPIELTKSQSWKLSREQDEARRIERLKHNEKQRAEQLKRLEELDADEVWIFIYNNRNPGLSQCVEEIESSRTTPNSLGWDLKVSKQQARKLISEGFRPKKVFAVIQVGNRNYADNRQGKKRYAVKEDQPRQEEETKNQYTFQKRKKESSEKSGYTFERKQSRRNGDHQQKIVRKDEYQTNSSPLYEGLGDFRNKDVLKKAVSYIEQSTQSVKTGVKYVQLTKKASHKQYDKPRYAEKQQGKPKYKQKASRPSEQPQDLIVKNQMENNQQQQSNESDSLKTPCVSAVIESLPLEQTKQQCQCPEQQQQSVVEKKEDIFTMQSSSISQQKESVVEQLAQRPQSQDSEEQESEEEKAAETQKSKKKKRPKNKNKAPKVKPYSNNPFDKLG